MSLYTRFGSEVKLVRPAVKADIKRIEKRRADKQDAKDLAPLNVNEPAHDFGQQLWVAEYVDGGGEVLVVMACLVADEGWKEITATAVAKYRELQGVPA